MALAEYDIETNRTRLHYAITGSGPAVVLIHGFPHTWRVWTEVIPALATRHQVIAVDLRGLGDSARATSGYDVRTLAGDIIGLLDALGIVSADLVATDAGVPPAFLASLEHPDRVRRLVLLEGTLASLPGAEDFFSAGPPWWFGLHQVPGLAEVVLEGHEAEYVGWFLRAGTRGGHGLDAELEATMAATYVGRESLRCAFEYYRAMPANDAILRDAVAAARLKVPTLAIGAWPVGDALARQLLPISDDLTTAHIPDSGHIIALDRPDVLGPMLAQFLS